MALAAATSARRTPHGTQASRRNGRHPGCRSWEREQAAASLAALVEAQKQREEEFETEIAARGDEQASHLAAQRTELQAEIDSARATWEKERAACEAATREARAAEERERKRRQEEFEYILKRECQQKKDKLADLSASLGAAYAKVQDIAVKAVDSSSRQLKNVTFQAGNPPARREDRR